MHVGTTIENNIQLREFGILVGEQVRDKINLAFFFLSADADFISHSHHNVCRR